MLIKLCKNQTRTTDIVLPNATNDNQGACVLPFKTIATTPVGKCGAVMPKHR